MWGGSGYERDGSRNTGPYFLAIRFGTGGTLSEFFEGTTPQERAHWAQHFRKYPVGDFYLHNLVARLCSLVASVFSSQYVHPREFAPWIDWHSDTNAAEAAQERMIQSGLSNLMDAVMDRMETRDETEDAG